MPNHPATPHIEPLVVNEKTAAELLGLSPSSLEKDRVHGHLGVPYAKAGRRVIYQVADLKSWLDDHRVVQTSSGCAGGENNNSAPPTNQSRHGAVKGATNDGL